MLGSEWPTRYTSSSSTDQSSVQAKPRLLFFRKHGDLPPFILSQLHQHVMCLSEFFEVHLVSQDCSYKEICESLQPDLILVEAGAYGVPPDVTDKLSYPEVPKLGLLNADAYCPTRTTFLAEMERWGIETYFTISVSMPEYLPSISDRLFIWPNFIDPSIYRDYEQPKTIPVLAAGSQAMHYPWRSRINKIIAQYYPTLVCPHFGWFDANKTTRMVYDAEYAKLINSAWIAPTCGTVAREVVRKHFEIPGCNSCLVTERTLALEDAGFADMQNCVFVTEADVMDKLDYLFANRDVLAAISTAGRLLVHSRHTVKQRDQILQWYNLNKSRNANQRIVQPRPFGPLTLVDNGSHERNYRSLFNSLDRAILREANEQLQLGNYAEADRRFLSCLNYHSMPEPFLGLALSSLNNGNANSAIRWISELITSGFEVHRAIEPDPVEWAYFIVSLLCSGNLAEATKRAGQFPLLRHQELDRCRRILDVLNGSTSSPHAEGASPRPSIHQLPERDTTQWIDELCKMLKACKQSEFCELLQASLRDGRAQVLQKAGVGGASLSSNPAPDARESILPLVPGSVKARIRRHIPERIRPVLTKLKAWLNRRDGFASAVDAWARKEEASRALLLGASCRSAYTRAFLDGIQGNPSMPTVLCMSPTPNDSRKLRKRFGQLPQIKFSPPSSLGGGTETGAEHFDLVLIDQCNDEKEALEAIAGARTILVGEIDTNCGHAVASALLSKSQYLVADDSLSHGSRSIIFTKAHRGVC